jgi:hypothetical protein
MERINAALEQYLQLFVDWAQDDWVDWLPLAKFAGNNTTSETTGVSPFFANYSFHPRMGIEPAQLLLPQISEVQKREYFRVSVIATRFKAVINTAVALARQAQDRYDENANRHQMDTIAYHVGDGVMLHMKNYKTGQPTCKLEPRWEGPFEVLKVLSHAVTLWLPVNMKIFNTFHMSMVRPYRSNGVPR